MFGTLTFFFVYNSYVPNAQAKNDFFRIYNIIYGTCVTESVMHGTRKMENNFLLTKTLIFFLKLLITMVTPLLVPKMGIGILGERH